jgi:hypothetical protein
MTAIRFVVPQDQGEGKGEGQNVFLNPQNGRKSGQAMIEFVMVIIVVVLLVSAVCDFIPIFTASLRQQNEAHSNMGRSSILDCDEGMAKQQSDDFKTDLRIPFLLTDGEIQFSEAIEFPAANLKSYFSGAIDITGDMLAISSMQNENDQRTSKCKSWVVVGAPRSVKNTVGSLLNSDWIRYENLIYENDNEQEYVYVYTLGDETAPSAIAAIYVGPAESCPDKSNPNVSTVTIIARTAGAQ